MVSLLEFGGRDQEAVAAFSNLFLEEIIFPLRKSVQTCSHSLGIGGACSMTSCESTAIAVVSWHRLFCYC